MYPSTSNSPQAPNKCMLCVCVLTKNLKFNRFLFFAATAITNISDRNLSVHDAIPNSSATLHLAGHATCGKIGKCEPCRRRTRPFQIPLEEFTAARRLIPSKDSDALLEPQTFPQRYKGSFILLENRKSFIV